MRGRNSPFLIQEVAMALCDVALRCRVGICDRQLDITLFGIVEYITVFFWLKGFYSG
jgi:hypothetical protein